MSNPQADLALAKSLLINSSFHVPPLKLTPLSIALNSDKFFLAAMIINTSDQPITILDFRLIPSHNPEKIFDHLLSFEHSIKGTHYDTELDLQQFLVNHFSLEYSPGISFPEPVKVPLRIEPRHASIGYLIFDCRSNWTVLLNDTLLISLAHSEEPLRLVRSPDRVS